MHNKPELPKTPFRFIWYFLSQLKPIVLLYVFLTFAAGLFGPFNSILMKNIINLVHQIDQDNAYILLTPIGLIVLNFIIFDNVTWRIIGYIRAYYYPIITNKIVSTMMSYVLEHSHRFFQNNLSGKITKQISNLADSIEALISSIAANFFRGSSLLFFSSVTVYFVNPVFFIILIIWFLLFSSISIMMSKKLVTLSNVQAETESSVVGELVDTVSNQNNVRIFARKFYETSRLMKYLLKYRNAYYNTSIYSMLMSCVQGALIALMMGFSGYFLVKLYAQNLVNIGDFVLIFTLLQETAHMMWYIMSQVDEFNKALGRCKQSLFTIMHPIEITDKPNAIKLECLHGNIQFNSVDFSYKDTEPLFRNQSINISAGQKVGLVGYSGGGKSTFASLIMRLYDVNDGEILIDDHDIRDVTQDSLHDKIGMIPQDPVLFQRSLMDNIRYGRVEATDEEVIEASKKAHAHDFIHSLDEGYSALVGERGIKLSGGQRQRIAIARAVLKNAPILILDEATSQLDSITENLIQESLWDLMKNKTAIVIAHRLSTLLHMDRILVFDKGAIIEDANHNDLLKSDTLYKKLWDAQVGGFLGDKSKKTT